MHVLLSRQQSSLAPFHNWREVSAVESDKSDCQRETKKKRKKRHTMDRGTLRQTLIGFICKYPDGITPTSDNNILSLPRERQFLPRENLTCDRSSGSILIIDCGLHEGWSTPTIPKFNGEDPLKVTNNEIAWIVNLMYVGVGIGSLIPFLLMDNIGRKGTLLVTTVPKIASWIFIGTSTSVPLMYVGRILAGIGCGITYAVMPMYLGEISSKRTRGPLGTARSTLSNASPTCSVVKGLLFIPLIDLPF